MLISVPYLSVVIPFYELQGVAKECSRRKLPATGTAEVLRNRLLGKNENNEGGCEEKGETNKGENIAFEEMCVAFIHLCCFLVLGKVKEPTIGWQYSEVKSRLRDALMSDPQHRWWTMRAQDIFQEDELLRQYPNNCADRLRRLKTTIHGNIEKIAFDDKAAAAHKLLFPASEVNNRGNLRLHGHRAKALLELDVAAGKAEGITPAALPETRDEYKFFTDNRQWCKAVNKEKEKQKKAGFWMDKRNGEGQTRHAKRREAQLRDAGVNIN